jgi:hypothetical protein
VEIKVDAMHPGKKRQLWKTSKSSVQLLVTLNLLLFYCLHGWKTNCGNADWYICSIDDLMRPEHYEQTEESLGFKQEYEARRAKQVCNPGWYCCENEWCGQSQQWICLGGSNSWVNFTNQRLCKLSTCEKMCALQQQKWFTVFCSTAYLEGGVFQWKLESERRLEFAQSLA